MQVVTQDVVVEEEAEEGVVEEAEEGLAAGVAAGVAAADVPAGVAADLAVGVAVDVAAASRILDGNPRAVAVAAVDVAVVDVAVDVAAVDVTAKRRIQRNSSQVRTNKTMVQLQQRKLCPKRRKTILLPQSGRLRRKIGAPQQLLGKCLMPTLWGNCTRKLRLLTVAATAAEEEVVVGRMLGGRRTLAKQKSQRWSLPITLNCTCGLISTLQP